MKTCIQRFLVLLLTLAVLPSISMANEIFANDQAQINIENEYAEEAYEFYVTTDQLILCSEGIFANLENLGVLPVYRLTQVQPGMYTIKTFIICPDHGQYCPRCGGCDPSNRCQYRCKCKLRR